MNIKAEGIKLSVVILTKNEGGDIVDCVDCVSWCDEIIIVDDNSNDKTIAVVEKLKNKKIKVFSKALKNDFSHQRNFGLEKARGEWVLFVDADEKITDALRYEIEYILSSQNLLEQKKRGFYIRRIDIMWGRELKHGESGNIKLLRLARRDAGTWMGKVHEEWKIKGKVGQLKNPLYHYPHQTITMFLRKINFYTDIRAQELFHKRTKVYWWSIIAYPKMKFILNYFIKRGFLDGLAGFIFALIMSFHSFLVRGKLWVLWQKK